jgi:hypothetical protein
MTNYRTFGLALALLVGVASCDTEVTNPGPVQDDFLQGEAGRGGMAALVAGSGRALGSAINWISYTGAAVTREIHPAGSTGSFGITNRWQNGELNADDSDLNVHWEQAQRSRWVAEETVRRLEALGPPPTGSAQTSAQYAALLKQALVYAGFANRVLGENMCDCVIDGGQLQAGPDGYLQRAESLFTKALAVTGAAAATNTQLNNAAYGGRASVRLLRGNVAGADSDAQLVPIGFSYALPYYNIGEDAQRNRIFYSSGNSRESGSAYRAHTQWNTWHLQYKYGTATLTATTPAVTTDTRVPIAFTTLLGDAAIDCCDRVPFWPQAKHASSAAPVRLTSGREMQLIRAEERLLANDMGGAMGFINAARADGGAENITATDITDAWRLLKRERGIELWLEARRLGDLRRWSIASTPGALDPLETVGAASHLARQDLCFPVSRSERDANPNF